MTDDQNADISKPRTTKQVENITDLPAASRQSETDEDQVKGGANNSSELSAVRPQVRSL